jgi:hypothetical protein
MLWLGSPICKTHFNYFLHLCRQQFQDRRVFLRGTLRAATSIPVIVVKMKQCIFLQGPADYLAFCRRLDALIVTQVANISPCPESISGDYCRFLNFPTARAAENMQTRLCVFAIWWTLRTTAKRVQEITHQTPAIFSLLFCLPVLLLSSNCTADQLLVTTLPFSLDQNHSDTPRMWVSGEGGSSSSRGYRVCYCPVSHYHPVLIRNHNDRQCGMVDVCLCPVSLNIFQNVYN